MRALFLLAVVVALSGCAGQAGSLWGVVPQNTDVCPQGKNSVTGECR
ncbi:hypothetical protein [Serratia entomophila]|nr:hypothetical protein [Serratia entomophila]CAI0735477.1 Uncharacterised protein [Serratia entomophila]CAI1573771.1 Uncharacterised protein [Serratia entomophila]